MKCTTFDRRDTPLRDYRKEAEAGSSAVDEDDVSHSGTGPSRNISNDILVITDVCMSGNFSHGHWVL